MITQKDRDMIVKFLRLNYPVSRIKINGRFKRAIVLDSGIFQLSSKKNYKDLKIHLSKILYIVFNFNYEQTNDIIDNFLGL